MLTIYYVSVVEIKQGNVVKPYGCELPFKRMYDYCKHLLEKCSDKIPFLSTMEDFINAKGVVFNNPYPLGTMLREVLAEQVRIELFSHRPCRIGSVFSFKNYKDAYRFLFDYRSGKGWIYSGNTIEEKTFTCDMDIITYAKLRHDDIPSGYSEFKTEMVKYWEGKDVIKSPETICSAPVIIDKPANLGYRFNLHTGKFVCSTHLPVDSNENPVIPIDATLIPPPALASQQSTVFRNGEWVLL